MSKTRQEDINWEKMFKLVIGREKAEKMFNKRKSKELNSCSICAMNTMNKI